MRDMVMMRRIIVICFLGLYMAKGEAVLPQHRTCYRCDGGGDFCVPPSTECTCNENVCVDTLTNCQAKSARRRTSSLPSTCSTKEIHGRSCDEWISDFGDHFTCTMTGEHLCAMLRDAEDDAGGIGGALQQAYECKKCACIRTDVRCAS